MIFFCDTRPLFYHSRHHAGSLWAYMKKSSLYAQKSESILEKVMDMASENCVLGIYKKTLVKCPEIVDFLYMGEKFSAICPMLGRQKLFIAKNWENAIGFGGVLDIESTKISICPKHRKLLVPAEDFLYNKAVSKLIMGQKVWGQNASRDVRYLRWVKQEGTPWKIKKPY